MTDDGLLYGEEDDAGFLPPQRVLDRMKMGTFAAYCIPCPGRTPPRRPAIRCLAAASDDGLPPWPHLQQLLIHSELEVAPSVASTPLG
jgi:hypothetical protein